MFIGLTGVEGKDLAETKEYIQQYGITWPNGFGAQKTAQALGVRGYPTLMVFGPDGRKIWSGHSEVDLEKAIQRGLAALQPSKSL